MKLREAVISCSCRKNILIDCGMEQGPDLYENPGLPIAEKEIDYVFLTHAHIDHSGMLPKTGEEWI